MLLCRYLVLCLRLSLSGREGRLAGHVAGDLATRGRVVLTRARARRPRHSGKMEGQDGDGKRVAEGH